MKALDSFTVEQLNNFIESDHAQCGDVAALAAIALAAKRAEPIYQYQSGICNDQFDGIEWVWDDCDKGFYNQYDPARRRIVYTTPQLNSPEIPDYKSALLGLLMSCISKDHLGFFTLAGINKTNLIQAVEVSGATVNFDNVPRVDIGECLIPKGWIITPEIPEGWIKCSDQMPEKGIGVIAFSDDGSMWIAYYDKESRCWDDGDFFNDIPGITHWMPLPAAPESE